MVLASLPTPTGHCRDVEVIRAGAGRLDVALACTEGAGWTVQVVIVADLGTAARRPMGSAPPVATRRRALPRF